MISIDVGYDAGKKIHGRKRHLSVDLFNCQNKSKSVKAPRLLEDTNLAYFPKTPLV